MTLLEFCSICLDDVSIYAHVTKRGANPNLVQVGVYKYIDKKFVWNQPLYSRACVVLERFNVRKCWNSPEWISVQIEDIDKSLLNMVYGSVAR